ncbi:MAG TPA: hypothetical protein VKB59_13120 [Micromonosporaceae bacterium]|nr:hypothetical protein [Micromonosporaceae bacterium]
MLRPPKPDPGLDPFRDGIAVLRRDGVVDGHIASTVGTFWSPSRPLCWQWWVWFVVVWSDGRRERSFEDYPPWTTVREMQSGFFEWTDGDRYDIEWLAEPDRQRVRDELALRADEF